MSARAARTHALWIVLVTAPLAAGAQPTVDAALENFRAYRAALERNDLAGAERAAAAALAASEAANGARTAVLALNLANLRLELGEPHDALTPARTAHRLASTSADAGVDPVAATLTLGRAELAAHDPAGPSRLIDAMAIAIRRDALATDTYNAAVALGTWGIESNSSFGYNVARVAWGTAGRLAHTTDDPPFARARASTGEGMAIALAGMDRTTAETRGSGDALSPFEGRAADAAFSRALQLLRGRASEAVAEAGLTPIQLTYADALAWQSVVHARMQRTDEPLPSPSTAAVDDDRCALRVIAAAIPAGPLGDGVAAVMQDWRTEKDPSAAPSCRMPASFFFPVRFVLTER